MVKEIAYAIYLNAMTTKGTQYVNIINNVSSMAKIGQVVLSEDGHSVEFDYWAIGNEGVPIGASKKIVRKFPTFKINEIYNVCYGHKKIFVKVNAPKGEVRIICLVNNTGTPSIVDKVTIIGNDTIQYRYIDLKTRVEKMSEIKVNFQILGIIEILYGDLPRLTKMEPEVKQGFVDFIKFLNENKITYWAIGGTMLGTIRSHGIIQGDTNCNLAVLLDDITKMCELANQTYRFYFKDATGLLNSNRKIYGTIKVWDLKLGHEITDISYYKKSETVPEYWSKMNNSIDKSYYWHNSGDNSSKWSKANGGIFNIPESYLLPLKQDYFYNQRINIPNKADEYCKLVFGDKFMTHKNVNGNFIYEKDYKLEPIKDFSPY